jgi:uncharacterized protein (DUF2336 family)
MGTKVAVLVILDTDDRRLTPEAIDSAMATAGGVHRLRKAVLDRFARDMTRLVAVMPEEHARMLMLLHEAVGEDLGGDGFVRPPKDFVPPGDVH